MGRAAGAQGCFWNPIPARLVAFPRQPAAARGTQPHAAQSSVASVLKAWMDARAAAPVLQPDVAASGRVGEAAATYRWDPTTDGCLSAWRLRRVALALRAEPARASWCASRGSLP